VLARRPVRGGERNETFFAFAGVPVGHTAGVTEQLELVVFGAGQAGLAVSCELTHAGVDHVVLERARVGQTWRGRWDSFCLVTPNWTVQLPGHPYDRQEPNGFMHRDQVVS
jgi:cation diffusion facilitator CzcD-associated flavoprotein CzcO